MLYREIIAVCSQIHTKHTNTLCGQNASFLNAQPGGIQSKHWHLNGCILNKIIFQKIKRGYVSYIWKVKQTAYSVKQNLLAASTNKLIDYTLIVCIVRGFLSRDVARIVDDIAFT